jgi:hypothetical protein
MQGLHRNIFIDNSIVDIVTLWYNGYTITNSTRMIYRYLPNQVVEPIVYHLWLVLLSWQEVEVLALRLETRPSPFL